MILLCGIPSESPLALVRERLDEAGVTHITFNQRRFGDMALDVTIDGAGVAGELAIRGRRYPLEALEAVYVRLMDDRHLPELADEAPGSSARTSSRRLHETLMRWLEVTPARVVNRPSAMASNGSKPFQAHTIRDVGFRIPETLITNDPDAVRDFMARHRRVVYKSISGVRSIVRPLGEEDLARLERIRWCPVQFQAYVEGTDVRVHTVGRSVFATRVRTTVTDYRYAERDGGTADLDAVELPDGVAERCVRLAEAFGLDFAGIDLRVTPSGEWFCFEVNPSPAFSYYETHTGQPIAREVARYLATA